MDRLRAVLIGSGPRLGLVAVTLVALAAVVTALAYVGADGEPYSPLNHTVSELGEVAVSELAATFNAALIIGGLLIAVSMLGLGLQAGSHAGRLSASLGVAAGIAFASVGLFPADDFDSHKAAASAAFILVTLAAASFSWWIGRGGSGYSPSLAVLSVLVVAAMVAFLVLPGIVQPEYTFEVEFDPDPPPRPDIWLAAALEWAVLVTALVWIAMLSYLTPKRSKAPKAERQ